MIKNVMINVQIKVPTVYEPETSLPEDIDEQAKAHATETIRGRGMDVISIEIA